MRLLVYLQRVRLECRPQPGHVAWSSAGMLVAGCEGRLLVAHPRGFKEALVEEVLGRSID